MQACFHLQLTLNPGALNQMFYSGLQHSRRVRPMDDGYEKPIGKEKRRKR